MAPELQLPFFLTGPFLEAIPVEGHREGSIFKLQRGRHLITINSGRERPQEELQQTGLNGG